MDLQTDKLIDRENKNIFGDFGIEEILSRMNI